MADDHSVSSSRKPPVRYKPDRVAESKSDQSRCRCQHFAHSGPTLWSLVSDHVTSPASICRLRIAAIQSSSESKTRAGPVILRLLIPETLATAPSGARFPRRMARWPSPVHRVFEPPNDVGIGVEFTGDREQILCNRLTGDGEAVAVEEAVLEQHLHHERDTARLW